MCGLGNQINIVLICLYKPSESIHCSTFRLVSISSFLLSPLYIIFIGFSASFLCQLVFQQNSPNLYIDRLSTESPGFPAVTQECLVKPIILKTYCNLLLLC